MPRIKAFKETSKQELTDRTQRATGPHARHADKSTRAEFCDENTRRSDLALAKT